MKVDRALSRPGRVVRSALALLTPVALLSGYGALGGLPKCGSSDATGLVGEIVNELLVEEGFADERFVRLRDIEELGYNAEDQLRSCYATLVTTDGEAEVQYSVRWTDKSKGEFWVEASIR